MKTGLEVMSEIIVHSKYAKFKQEESRRETFEEICNRNMDMNMAKYPALRVEIVNIYENFVKTKKILPSMRALEDSTKIFTKSGFKLAGDIQKGDVLYDSNGDETNVKDVVKFKDKELFELTFSDKSKITACDEHLWIISTNDDLTYNKTRVVDTKFIREHLLQGDRRNITIHNPKPINMEEKQFTIDPYILGHWLGDGYSSGYQLSFCEEDASFFQEQYKNAGFETKQSVSSNIWTYSVSGLRPKLKEYGLVNNKHIPHDYFFGSIDQRLNLLQGLLDSDGHITPEGRCLFYNTNSAILDGVKNILSSLGIKYTETFPKKDLDHHLQGTSISFFTPLPVVRIPRKSKYLRKEGFLRTESRKVFSVKSVNAGNASCFHVDSPDHSFLAGEQMIVTHNSLQFAGKPIELSPNRLFNCGYLPIDSITAFSETMFLLLGGTGVGYSVQSHHVENLPPVRKPTKSRRYLIGDSIEGWADSIKALMRAYMDGKPMPRFDYSDIRDKGELLVTSGGKAPGSGPLKTCIHKIQTVLDDKNDGDQLTSLDVHDIQCHIADSVLSGGIRRAAMISFFDLDDSEMLSCKFGQWWELNPQRGRANNSAVILRHRVTKTDFLNLWERIKESGSGEPGFYLTNNADLLSNPCCFTGDTPLLTSEGYKNFSDLIGDTSLRLIGQDGVECDGKVWSTGVKKVVNVSFEDGNNITCTPDHIFRTVDMGEIEAKDLLNETVDSHNSIEGNKVVSVKDAGEQEVFDFNIDNEDHWGVVGNGYIAHNCEIALRPFQFCNLCEINMSNIESQEDLDERSKAAAFLGTLQAGYTDFHYLRDVWKKTTEKEALIGVSGTGIASGEYKKYDLAQSAHLVIEENIRVADLIEINHAARTTCVKPAGTSSIVLESSSGIHAWHSDYFIRRIRVGKNEAMYKYMSKVAPEFVEDEFFKPESQAVISVPIKAPDNSVTRHESAIDLLERVKVFSNDWVKSGHVKGENTHNVSATVNIKDDEWDGVAEWMWSNRESYNGLSVLNHSGHTYKQAPFEEIAKEEYEDLMSIFSKIDFDIAKVLEDDDNTEQSSELACAGGKCEVT